MAVYEASGLATSLLIISVVNFESNHPKQSTMSGRGTQGTPPPTAEVFSTDRIREQKNNDLEFVSSDDPHQDPIAPT